MNLYFLLIPFYFNIFGVQSDIRDGREVPKNITIQAYLRTRETADKIELEKIPKLHPEFSISRRTIVIAQDSASKMDRNLIKKLEDALLAWDDVNVITITWNIPKSESVSNRMLPSLKKLVTSISDHIGKFKIEIQFNLDTEMSDQWGYLHFIGIGIGAHVLAEVARNKIKNHKLWLPNRVTGLDPVGLELENFHKNVGLDKSVAPFVDVIYTNAPSKIGSGIGLHRRAGHVNFYVNGGKVQPGCASKDLSLLSTGKQTCSHVRAVDIFIESLKPTVHCWANVWDENTKHPNVTLEEQCAKAQCIEMGINAEKYKDKFDSAFYTITASQPPYCGAPSNSNPKES